MILVELKNMEDMLILSTLLLAYIIKFCAFA